LERSEKTKLLLLLSDGIPADVGYGGKTATTTSHYAIEDTRRAIAEARLAGVIPYCITIDRFAKRYIPHLYGEWSYTILHDVAMLPERLSRLYLKLTR
jgi:nitric oxide reductase NorD protein